MTQLERFGLSARKFIHPSQLAATRFRVYAVLNRFEPGTIRFSAQYGVERTFSAQTSEKPLLPLRHRMHDDFITWYAKKVKLYWQLLGGAAVLGAIGLYVMYNNTPPARKSVLAKFEQGSVPSEWAESDALADVPRAELHKSLQAILRPENASHSYAVIVGEHGTGKSTAVRKAARAKGTDDANGVVYIEVGDVRSFAIDLASCLNTAVPEIDWIGALRRRLVMTTGTQDKINIDLSKEPQETWLKIIGPLRAAADEFRRVHHRPMTLVIDGVHLFAAKDSSFLDKLQDFAKLAATTGNLQLVFVSSDKTALVHMQQRSSWSRATILLEIGDIENDEDAVDFLVRRRGLAKAHAVELVRDVTGGRFALLLEASASVSVSALRAIKYNQTSTVLKRMGLPPNHKFFQKLVAASKDGIYTSDALDMLPEKTLNDLLAANVLAVRANGTYAAHSRFVETFLKQQCL